MAGARPVFADIDPERLTIDPAAVASADHAAHARHSAGASVRPGRRHGRARRRSRPGTRLAIVEDCCQAHLATAGGRPVGTIGVAGAFSFYPTKNLGALGDGGAVVTNDRALADRIRRLRNGGQTDRYHHEEPGVNSRLDEMQAAILRARLPFLAGLDRQAPRARRPRIARRSTTAAVIVPPERDPGHVYHLFVVRAGGDAGAATRCSSAWPRAASRRSCTTRSRFRDQPAFAATDPADCPRAARGVRRAAVAAAASRAQRCATSPSRGRVRDFQTGLTVRESAHHRRRRIHRIASGRSAARRSGTRC